MNVGSEHFRQPPLACPSKPRALRSLPLDLRLDKGPNSDYIRTVIETEAIMKEVQVSDGIVPLGEFKSQAAKLLKRLAESGQPMVITQNGRPAGVLVSPQEFDRIQERQRFLESIAAGLADAEAGRVIDTAALRKLIRSRRAERSRE